MPQYDVYENVNEETSPTIPYVLDVQSDLLEKLATRVVVPLVAVSAIGKMIQNLNPTFRIKNVPVVMSTAELAGVSVRFLGKKVATLKDRRDEIIAALDFLFTGF
jgi:toxin CcdB